jgi:hypothetical protein
MTDDISLYTKGFEVFVANPYPEDDDKYFKAHLPNSSRPQYVPAVVESAAVRGAPDANAAISEPIVVRFTGV